jgi:AcrR family transcriptional regulator
MNKQPLHTASTRQNLIDAFWSLYCAKRIDRITVKEISLKAGYNRGTFYEYFPDVYGVLEHIELSLLPGSPEEFPPRSLPTDQGTERPLDEFIKMYEPNEKYFSVLLGEHGDPAFPQMIKAKVRPMIQSILPMDANADPFEADLIAEFALSAMLGVMKYWFTQEPKPPRAKFLALVYDLMERGVLGRAGG